MNEQFGISLSMSDQVVDQELVLDRIFDIIRRSELCSLATSCQDGNCHINTQYFCYDSNLRLYWLSDPDALHSRNLAIHPHCALAIYDSKQPWGSSLCGLQLFGKACAAIGEMQQSASQLYSERFDAFASFLNSLSPDDRDGFRSQFYMMEVSSAKILDEEVFGEEVYISVKIHV